jgi:hypothetical protein
MGSSEVLCLGLLPMDVYLLLQSCAVLLLLWGFLVVYLLAVMLVFHDWLTPKLGYSWLFVSFSSILWLLNQPTHKPIGPLVFNFGQLPRKGERPITNGEAKSVWLF